MKTIRARGFYGLILAVFFALRYGAEDWLLSFSDSGLEIFEAIFALGVMAWLKNDWKWQLGHKRSLALECLGAALLGFVVFAMLTPLGILFPLDLSLRVILILLLVVAPILEELLYRGAIWLLILRVTQSPRITWILTSVIFALAHGYAYFSLPDEIKSFVIFQTGYTFLIALWFGFSMWRRGGFGSSLFLHFFFNLGFYLSWKTFA